MVKARVRRLVNPRRKHKRNPGRKRRLTAKQIRYFGSPQQKAALKRKRRTAHAVHTVVRRKNVKRRIGRRASNPALVLTLGAVNPKGGRRKVARAKIRRRKKSNPRRRRSRNATRVVVMAPRRHNRKRTAKRRSNPRRHRYARRNPQLFGSRVTGTKMATAVGGGLIGVAAAKFIPTMIPSGLVSGNIMKVVATGVSAWLAGWLVGKANKDLGDAVLFGGLMQTGSVALNAFLPSVGGQFGLGDIVPGMFPIPQNPISAGIRPAVAQAPRVNMSGMGRAFGSAF